MDSAFELGPGGGGMQFLNIVADRLPWALQANHFCARSVEIDNLLAGRGNCDKIRASFHQGRKLALLFLGLLAHADVEESNHSAHWLSGLHYRVAPILGRETGSIGTPENFVLGVTRFSVHEGEAHHAF